MEEMETMLKDLDAVTRRTGVSYGDAYEAFLKNDKDVIRTVIAIEKEQRPKNYFGISQMMEKTKETKIQIMKDNEKLGEIPAAAGILGLAATCLLPRFAVIGAVGSIAALLNDVNLEIHAGHNTKEAADNSAGSERMNGNSAFSADRDFVIGLADTADQNSKQRDQ